MYKRRGIAAVMLGGMLTVSVLPADVDLAAAAMPKLSRKSITVEKGKSVTMTGLTFWGLYDSVFWRAEGLPLLFASITKTKGVYYKVLEAAAR